MKLDNNARSSKTYIGCCGAYCKTCKPYRKGFCKGCKLGYEKGERYINKTKCRIKTCCFKEKKLEICADCVDYSNCKIIHGFYNKKGFKYSKYEQAVEFIRQDGYEKFIKIAGKWRGPYGKYQD